MKRIIAALGLTLGLMFVLSHRLARPRPAVVLADDYPRRLQRQAVGPRRSLRSRRPASVTASDCRRPRVAPPRTTTSR